MSAMGPKATVIDGNQAGSVVTCQSGEASNSILDGFTITNGTGTYSWGAYFGGGINCNYYSSPTITNNTIFGNTAGYGGAMCSFLSSPTITNNIIPMNLNGFIQLYLLEVFLPIISILSIKFPINGIFFAKS